MNTKTLIIIAAVIAGAAFWCFGGSGSASQQKVEKSVFTAAVDTAQKTIDAAQRKNTKEFVKLAFDYRNNRNGYYECYLLLRNVSPVSDAQWQVKRDANNGCINVSCKLDESRKLLIVLKKLPDNTMRFVYACTLNS